MDDAIFLAAMLGLAGKLHVNGEQDFISRNKQATLNTLSHPTVCSDADAQLTPNTCCCVT